MEDIELSNPQMEREKFAAQVRLALANVFEEYANKPNLLRPRINSCLEENFGVHSRDVSLRINEDSAGFSVKFMHPVHGDITLEA